MADRHSCLPRPLHPSSVGDKVAAEVRLRMSKLLPPREQDKSSTEPATNTQRVVKAQVGEFIHPKKNTAGLVDGLPPLT